MVRTRVEAGAGVHEQIIPTVVAATKEGEFDRAQCARVMGLIISPSG